MALWDFQIMHYVIMYILLPAFLNLGLNFMVVVHQEKTSDRLNHEHDTANVDVHWNVYIVSWEKTFIV